MAGSNLSKDDVDYFSSSCRSLKCVERDCIELDAGG